MLDFAKFANQKNYCAGIGEVLFDVYETGPELGGAPANFAYHCKQSGLDGIAISAVGKDDLGARARDLIAARFMPALMPMVNKETGAVIISLDDKSVPTYTFRDDTAYDNIPLTAEILEVASKLTVACFGTLAQRSPVSRHTIYSILDAMKKENILRIFDVNLRRDFYNVEMVKSSLKRCEVLKCNEQELPVLAKMLELKDETPETFFHYLKSQNIFMFVLTEGDKQSAVYLNDEVSVVKTPKVNAIDTVGAGDSFTGTLVTSLINGLPLKQAHQRAALLSAYICTQKGAMPDTSEYLKKL